ncbi:protein phosphatase 2C domain-containing protein [Aquisalimonas lutea]|uniref:PP2C family protein-serine/threonine phosphatase n=1 Tax=Aquisalimonas lutea TaxID=1327750 RepID=UPI0025B5EE3C|nr:protein phosphatase 2C domain-containing protein [Aquisalimonas lutea]MDN3519590.1 protein phosphatase 2C domain-containing protein [Aquisalimonas lutea]
MSSPVDECLFSIAVTHAGYRRSRNEDAVLARDHYGLWAVADGMGGHSRGDEASRAVIAGLDDLAAACRGNGLARMLAPTLQQVNARIHARAASLDDDATMGSTAVVLALEEDGFYCCWAGDSRAYLFRDGRLEQLTRDHCQAADGTASSVLTRAVGAREALEVDAVGGELYEDDVFLLCSDGLTAVVGEATIAGVLGHAEPVAVGERLVESALAAGGPDNISCVAVFVRGGSG